MNDCRRQNYGRSDQNSMDTLGHFPVAMAYVPWQQFGQTYDLAKAFSIGTVFQELNKPFGGKRGNYK